MRVGPRPYEEKRPNNKGNRTRHQQYTDRLGRSKEKAAMVALSKGPLPVWIKSYRLANFREDAEGKDLVILTDFGEVYIQIKSSAEACREFMDEPRAFQVEAILIKSTDRLEFVRDNVLLAARRLRRKLMHQHSRRKAG